MEKEFFLSFVILLVFIDFVQTQNCTDTNKNNVLNDLPQATWSLQTFDSPGWETAYFASMDCSWKFDSGSGSDRVVIDVREYHIEGSNGCLYDSLTFYDGQTTSDSADKVCNVQTTGKMFVTSGQYGLLRLKSDFSVQMAGFTLRYMIGKSQAGSGCSSVEILTATGTVQYLTNPQWPDIYDVASNCGWKLNPTTSNYGIEINVIFMDLVAGEICFSDKLELFNGENDTAALLTPELCDSRTTFPSRDIMTFRTTGNNAYVKFTTQRSGWNRRGFVIGYKEVDIGLTTTTVPTTTTPMTSSTCSSSTVMLTATGTSKLLTSPGYPIFYSPNLVCSWLIETTSSNIIHVKVVDSNLEDSEGCMGDSVTLYDGSSSNAVALTSYCGELSSDVNSTSNKLYISFRTDTSVGARGFKLEYYSSEGTTPACININNVDNLTATTDPQYFTSPDYPNNYNSSSTVQWLIHNPTNTGVIRLEVIDSFVEPHPSCRHDNVTVYKGPCTSYPVLERFCGVSKPTITQNTGSYVLVVLRTDYNTEFKGFNIKYYLTTETSEESTLLRNTAIIVGAVLGSLFLLSLIIVLIIAIKKGKMPCNKSSSSKSKRSSSLSSFSSSESDSDMESHGQKLPARKTRLPPLPSAKLRNLPQLTLISKKSPIPAIKK